MYEAINEDVYRKIDEERIKQALEKGSKNDAFVLFRYSVLSKEDFDKLQQRHTYYGVFDQQMKEYFKEKEKERIEKAFIAHQDEAAEFIFQTSSHITEKEYLEIKKRFRLEKN